MKKKFQAVKGTRDFLPGTLDIRENVIRTIEKIFKIYGYRKWDGPALEYWDTLIRKSGSEVEKEIYVFEDKGGRKLGLRFELTASLARMIANSLLKMPIKAYSVGKVWRYENPQRGRYREFLQMDADIFGSSSVLCEIELLTMATNVFEELGFNNFYILLNNRKILEAQVECSGIPQNKKFEVFRALDKLNKIGYNGVKEEFIKRGLSELDFEKFMSYITFKKDKNLEKIKTMKKLLKNNPKGLEGLNELNKIIKYSEITGISGKIQIDFSLARGLDYYTGPIYEIKIRGKEKYGSIAGGGRYDELVALYGGRLTPAVGISFGIERIIDIIEKNEELKKRYQETPCVVYIVNFGKEYINHVLKIAECLRKEKIPTDFDLLNRNYLKQLQYAAENEVPFVLFIGDEEIKTELYTIKNMKTGVQEKLTLDQIIKKLKKVI